jgi:hypothetical protein
MSWDGDWVPHESPFEEEGRLDLAATVLAKVELRAGGIVLIG